MIHRWWLCVLLTISGCGGSDAGQGRAMELAADLDSTAPDTASAQRKEEFDRCAYVYQTDQGLRECLVVKHGWPVDDVARAIGVYHARLRARLDSIDRELARLRAEEQQAKDREAAKAPYWGWRSMRVYFANRPGCAMTGLVTKAPGNRVSFPSPEAAERAGYSRSKQQGC